MTDPTSKDNKPYVSAPTGETLEEMDRYIQQNMERISTWKSQLLIIVKKYDAPDYAVQNYRESDLFHAGIFVRELLKNGVSESELETLSGNAPEGLGPTALRFLDDAVRQGIKEYKIGEQFR